MKGKFSHSMERSKHPHLGKDLKFSTWAGSAQQVGGKGASSERLGGDAGPPERLQRTSSFPLKVGASLERQEG